MDLQHKFYKSCKFDKFYLQQKEISHCQKLKKMNSCKLQSLKNDQSGPAQKAKIKK